jgi:ElaB/YqjD/DUF883 family membrane-anchored ribosome-binding protein
MPEKLHKTSDVPDFQTYPEDPRVAAPNLSVTERSYARGSEPFSSKVERVKQVAGDAKDKVRDVASRVRSQAAATYEKVSDRGLTVAQEQFDSLRNRARNVRGQARTLAQEKPVHVIVAAGVIGLLAGLGARYWRSRA